MTRKQLKYFGTKRQKAAAKAARKRGRKGKKSRVGATPKRKKAKRGTVTAVTKTKRKNSRSTGIRGPMKNITKSLLPGAAAFGGGYLSGMVEDALPIDDPTMRTGAVAVGGLLLVMMQPTGVMGAAGLGMIGGAGRSMADGGNDAASGDAAVRGVGRRGRRRNPERVKAFREAVQKRMGDPKRQVVSGMPDDRSVITGPGRPGARYSRF